MLDTARVSWTVSEPSREEIMGEIDRRSALMLGVAIAGTALVAANPTVAQPYRPDEGKELAPGVRLVEVSEREAMHGRDSVLPAYKRIKVVDIVFQPNVTHKDDAMRNDMVCQCLDGEIRLDHRDGHPFTVKKNDVWTCVKGEPEDTENIGNSAAIMRVTNLIPA
jgi:quercetin dioxygenase-like cupin family protein